MYGTTAAECEGALSSPFQLQDAYANTASFLAYIHFLQQRDVLCSTMRQYCSTARAVLAFCKSFVRDSRSLLAQNIADLVRWYTKLSTSCSRIGKRAHSTPSPLHAKILDPIDLMTATDYYVDNAMGVVEAKRLNFSEKHAYNVMLGCMAGLTFGYAATPRPGQLLSLVHPRAPRKCTCTSPSCVGNTFIEQPNGDLTMYVTHHKNEWRSGRPQPPVNFAVGHPLHAILTWWITIGFFIWRTGTITDDETDIKHWYMWCNSEGDPFTISAWNRRYGDMLFDLLGARMPPNLAR